MRLRDYHESVTTELKAVSKRVRSLIRNHWGEDGRHHEVVLKNVIRRFLPERYAIGTGFVIKPTEERGNHIESNQIDLIVYDKDYPAFFREGDFVILTPDAVKGIIQVKANLQNQDRPRVYDDCNENGLFIFQGKEDQTKPLFNGIFSFDGYVNPSTDFEPFGVRVRDSYVGWIEQFEGDFSENMCFINHIAINSRIFVKHWDADFSEDGQDVYSIYRIRNLAYSFFISNLIDVITDHGSVGHDSYLWYPENKEVNKLFDF